MTLNRNFVNFPNVAGRGDEALDEQLAAELLAAGIQTVILPASLREHYGVEVKSVIVGDLHGWSFKRAWRYWVAEGPGVPFGPATALHETHGASARVAGHCGCPSPLEWYKGLGVGNYHVDGPDGLKALAETNKQVVADASGPIDLGTFPFGAAA